MAVFKEQLKPLKTKSWPFWARLFVVWCLHTKTLPNKHSKEAVSQPLSLSTCLSYNSNTSVVQKISIHLSHMILDQFSKAQHSSYLFVFKQVFMDSFCVLNFLKIKFIKFILQYIKIYWTEPQYRGTYRITKILPKHRPNRSQKCFFQRTINVLWLSIWQLLHGSSMNTEEVAAAPPETVQKP